MGNIAWPIKIYLSSIANLVLGHLFLSKYLKNYSQITIPPTFKGYETLIYLAVIKHGFSKCTEASEKPSKKSGSWCLTVMKHGCTNYPYQGNLARGLRISNYIEQRKQFLWWDLHCQAFAKLPITIIGHNPKMPQIDPSLNGDHLKRLLQQHRFYVHTSNPQLEDGFYVATVEAMAARLPIVGNNHPSSPIEHGVSGFLSDDPRELKMYAQQLLEDQELAQKMGAAARRTAKHKFSTLMSQRRMSKAIAQAQRLVAVPQLKDPQSPSQPKTPMQHEGTLPIVKLKQPTHRAAKQKVIKL